MKKTIIAALILAIATMAGWSQNAVEEMDGFNWVAMSRPEKLRVITGFWLAEIAMKEQLHFEVLNRRDLSEEKKNACLAEISAKFLTPGTVGNMVDEIDRSYEKYSIRGIPLWFVLGLMHHPDWYGTGKGQ